MVTMAWAEVPDYGRIITLANPVPEENYRVAGISNAGNVFGTWGGENLEQGIQWLVSTGYAAENVGNGPFPIPVPPAPRGPGIQPYGFNGAGIASGRALISHDYEWNIFQYNVDTQEWFDLGGNEGHGSNSAGKTVDDLGDVYFQDGSPAGTAPNGNPWDINDFDVLVGWTGSPRQAATWKPSAVDAHDWGEVIVLPGLADLDNRAYNLSDRDPSFASGISMDMFGLWHGMVWNLETGAVAADFGMDTDVGFAMNSAGTMVGGRKGTSACLRVRSADDWTT